MPVRSSALLAGLSQLPPRAVVGLLEHEIEAPVRRDEVPLGCFVSGYDGVLDFRSFRVCSEVCPDLVNFFLKGGLVIEAEVSLVLDHQRGRVLRKLNPSGS